MSKTDMDFLKQEFVRILEDVVTNTDAILLSGGLDTSSISIYLEDVVAITVCFGKNCPDLQYAEYIAKKFGFEHHILYINKNDAIKYVRDVIKILRTFDPAAVRNGVPIYAGIKYAKDIGLKSVMTGDGGDELFAGYSFLLNKPFQYVERWIKDIVNTWHFNSTDIGKHFGINVIQPYLAKEMVDFALNVPVKYKIGIRNGKVYGKYIVRLAMEKFLPERIVWREKMPIEVGSGCRKFENIFRGRLPENIELWSEEHAYYYAIYLQEIGNIPEPKEGEKKCPLCGGGIPAGRNHCRICGWYHPAVPTRHSTNL